jgi:aspartate aminotransferase
MAFLVYKPWDTTMAFLYSGGKMIISNKIQKLIANQEGWTRRMFEEGLRIKKQYGEENVCDFSLGNPDTEPPEEVQKTLVETLSNPVKGMHRYMSNNGYEDVREEIATYLREQHGVPFTANHIFMTVGCAGGLNILFKSMLSKGDEVIVPSPFFWEFKNYIENHGGAMRLVQTKKDFQLDIEKIEKAITKKTKAVLLNSPNNPTGAIYTGESVKGLIELLNEKRDRTSISFATMPIKSWSTMVFNYPISLRSTIWSMPLLLIQKTLLCRASGSVISPSHPAYRTTSLWFQG